MHADATHSPILMPMTTVDLTPLRTVLPELPCDGEGPVFRAPWEAQAFAMTLALHQRGAFTWIEWAAHLNRAIREAQHAGDPDLGDTYYQHWLTALERISSEKGLVDAGGLVQRRHDWEAAARRTPHGQPIELRRVDEGKPGR